MPHSPSQSTNLPTAPLTPAQLTTHLLPPRQHTRPLAQQAITTIKDTLAFYALCIDAKRFADLAHVFTPAALLAYGPGFGTSRGLAALQRRLARTLGGLPTQHLLGAVLVQLDGEARALGAKRERAPAAAAAEQGGKEEEEEEEEEVQAERAYSVAYMRALHFGMAGSELESECAVGHVQYHDWWVREQGVWKIERRELVAMGPTIGNLAVFQHMQSDKSSL